MNKNVLLVLSVIANLTLFGCSDLSSREVAESLIKKESMSSSSVVRGWSFTKEEPPGVRIVEQRDTFLQVVRGNHKVVGYDNDPSNWKGKRVLAEVTSSGNHGFFELYYIEKEEYRKMLDKESKGEFNYILEHLDGREKGKYVLLDMSISG